MTTNEQEIIRSLENCSLDLNLWTQRTHVAVAYILLREYPFDAALDLLRERIKAFNAHHGIEESEMSGYNETTTVALLTLVNMVMRAYDDVLPVSNADEFCDAHPELMSKHVLRLFYSPARRMHPDAKVRFIEPDLAPLPQIPQDASKSE